MLVAWGPSDKPFWQTTELKEDLRNRMANCELHAFYLKGYTPLRIHPWKRKIIFQTIIFRFYVNLPGCTFSLNQTLPKFSRTQPSGSFLPGCVTGASYLATLGSRVRRAQGRGKGSAADLNFQVFFPYRIRFFPLQTWRNILRIPPKKDTFGVIQVLPTLPFMENLCGFLELIVVGWGQTAAGLGHSKWWWWKGSGNSPQKNWCWFKFRSSHVVVLQMELHSMVLKLCAYIFREAKWCISRWVAMFFQTSFKRLLDGGALFSHWEV